MESDGFNGLAVFIIVAVITGVLCYLAVMQSRVKKQIEESRRERERAELIPANTAFIPPTSSFPPNIGRDVINDVTPSSLPIITAGGTPPPEPDSGDTESGESGASGSDGGGHSGGHH
jgi:hypothetical protein